MLCKTLTGGGGFARVDMSDDDDIDMSLFFTVSADERSATAAYNRRHGFDIEDASACSDGFCLPHRDGWYKGCVEIL